jgi:hypothetical protein
MKQFSFYKIAAVGIFAVVFFVAPVIFCAHAHAQTVDLTVLPAVIDGKGVPHDMLNYSLTITNTSGHQENIFATVCELTASGTRVFANPSMEDRVALLADWIGVSRGAILLKPGESTTTPVQIQISPYAAAGNYHAVIAFVQGGTRDDAEHNLNGAPQTLVNMAVASNLAPSLAIKGFSAAKSFYAGFPVIFNYIIENSGDASSTPSGEVMFYDKAGHEIGSVDANPQKVAIAPGQKSSFSARWQSSKGFGQYKAVLDLSYGAGDNKIESTALVWVLPWEKLLAIFGTLFVVMIALAIWLHRIYERRHHRRRRAIESLLKRGAVPVPTIATTPTSAPTPSVPSVMHTTIDLRHPHE